MKPVLDLIQTFADEYRGLPGEPNESAEYEVSNWVLAILLGLALLVLWLMLLRH